MRNIFFTPEMHGPIAASSAYEFNNCLIAKIAHGGIIALPCVDLPIAYSYIFFTV
jgi:hypothetical protein